MKIYLLILYLFPFTFLGQQSKFDSLLYCLKNSHEDTTRLDLLISLSVECVVDDNLKYAIPAVELANKLLIDISKKNPLSKSKKK